MTIRGESIFWAAVVLALLVGSAAPACRSSRRAPVEPYVVAPDPPSVPHCSVTPPGETCWRCVDTPDERRWAGPYACAHKVLRVWVTPTPGGGQ